MLFDLRAATWQRCLRRAHSRREGYAPLNHRAMRVQETARHPAGVGRIGAAGIRTRVTPIMSRGLWTAELPPRVGGYFLEAIPTDFIPQQLRFESFGRLDLPTTGFVATICCCVDGRAPTPYHAASDGSGNRLSGGCVGDALHDADTRGAFGTRPGALCHRTPCRSSWLSAGNLPRPFRCNPRASQSIQ